MARQQTTPFENIEGALEYVGFLLEASREAQKHVETEITSASRPELARKTASTATGEVQADRAGVACGGEQTSSE